jgi:hypothetical protein
MILSNSIRLVMCRWSLVFVFIVCTACSKYVFVDKKSTYDEWDRTPMNSRYLKIEMIDSLTMRPVEDRLYYLTYYRGNLFSIRCALVEVNTKYNIKNYFPLSTNKRCVVLKEGELFVAPSVFRQQLEICAEYKAVEENNNSRKKGFYDFKTYSIWDSTDLKSWKRVIIDFENKRGLLIDTCSKIESRIWF